ncbi:MAG TPA: MFS transporter [Vitreimonas sp.]|uniref:MFS transporter n=1 Tax=Vitreimonas sp. TaxID=3069702 RepID=UPI002D3ED911|nr:MFS transporter [Vitreimonas sp.]HYD86687.1 MFS transporter [Vitreimonas sp.]
MTTSKGAERKISYWEIAAFAAPAAPLLALSLPVIIFLPPHFAEHLGLPLWAVSAIFLGARVFDLLIDPWLGGLQDRTESRFGRRRFWLGLSTPFLMVLLWLVFLGLPQGVPPLAAGLAVFVMYIAYASMMIAHLGWAGELQPTYHGRTHVLGAVQTAGMIGQVLMLVIAGVVAQGFNGSNADAVHAMGWTLLALAPITAWMALTFVREPYRPPQPHMSLRDTLGTLFANKLAMRVLLPDLLLGIAQGASGGLFLFYFQFVLRFEGEAQTLLAIYFIAGLVGVPIWWWAARRFGKHIALQGALVFGSVTTAGLLFLPAGNFAVVAPLMAIAGLAQGGGVLLTRALMADVVDEDELRTGARRSGLYFGVMLTTSKLGVAAGPLTYAVLGLVGFAPALGADNSATALGMLSFLFIGVPIALYLASALSLNGYPLDEKAQAELHAAIEARHAANSENTLGPVTK